MVLAATGSVAVDEFLGALEPDARAALEQLRGLIRATAPEATETISYDVPTFHHHGALVAYGVAKQHCSFYVMRPPLVATLRDEIAPHRASGGTIHFTAEHPLPAALVERVVRARMAENEAAR